MSVRIRLRRMGRRNHPFFRVIASDGRTATTGRFIENLGWYDPNKKGVNYELKLERLDYWIKNGAQMSDTVSNIAGKARKAIIATPAAPAPVAEAPVAVDAEAPAADTPAES